MILYAVQDSTGNYWDFDNRRFYSPCNNARRNTTFNLAVADAVAKISGGHVVELAGPPAKIVVSAEEAEMLEQAKCNKYPATLISNHTNDEDRLMRAYVIGWEVEKPKRYLVRVPHTNSHYYYQKCDSGEVIPVWDMETEPPTQFTDAEIEHYGLQYCECVEVTNHEQ